MKLKCLTPHLGAEVLDLRIAEIATDPELAASVRDAFDEHRVLLFRNQQIDREQHKAFGRIFGALHVHPSKASLGAGGDPELFTVRTRDGTTHVNGGRWHMDVSCEPAPPAASILRLLTGPTVGGDTVFANMHLAFELLSAPIRELLMHLRADHDGLQDLRWYGVEPKPGQTYPSATHPAVTAHPRTGRPTLFVNEAFTARFTDLSTLESDALLRMLFDHIARNPALHCRVTWQPDTIVMWDNLAVQHHAVWDYVPSERRGERVSVLADSPPVAYEA